jgi:hypothetical protein
MHSLLPQPLVNLLSSKSWQALRFKELYQIFFGKGSNIFFGIFQRIANKKTAFSGFIFYKISMASP